VTAPASYRGRLAPSPTGYLHLGHARTFWIAQQRAVTASGTLILRNDDLDGPRCRPEFVAAMFEDLRWFGLRWSEGPDIGGPFAPYDQSARLAQYTTTFERLRAGGFIYPCTCSRQDVLRALTAPHQGEDEPIYPGNCRNAATDRPRAGVNWRFRVPNGETIIFYDGACGAQSEVAGRDFGDFLVWRKDDFPSYQLACVADDAAMQITEVVRGADLITSTFRQLLLYRALGLAAPEFYHCPLIKDEHGQRLAKRHDALSLRALRAQGRTPEELRRSSAAVRRCRPRRFPLAGGRPGRAAQQRKVRGRRAP
jgi:glutamyl-tRNA synthetase